MRNYVLDANALLVFLVERPGAARVQKLLRAASRQGSPVYMSAVNWGEVIYVLRKLRGEIEARNLSRNAEQLPITVLAADRERATKAGELKIIHGLGYADCFAAGLAIELAATLVTADPEFQKIGKKLKIEFLSRHEPASGN